MWGVGLKGSNLDRVSPVNRGEALMTQSSPTVLDMAVGFFAYVGLRVMLTPPLLDIGVPNVAGFLAVGMGGVALTARLMGCRLRWLFLGALGLYMAPLLLHWVTRPPQAPLFPPGIAEAEWLHGSAVAAGIAAAHVIGRLWELRQPRKRWD